MATFALLSSSPPRTASAQLHVTAQAEGIMQLESNGARWEAAPGIGVAGFMGFRIALHETDVVIVPEAGGGYAWFSDSYSRAMARVVGGARLLLLGKVAPFAYLHAGWGRTHGTDDDAVLDLSGAAIDAGGGVTYALDSQLAVGAQLSYGMLVFGVETPTGRELETAPWVSVGANGSVRF